MARTSRAFLNNYPVHRCEQEVAWVHLLQDAAPGLLHFELGCSTMRDFFSLTTHPPGVPPLPEPSALNGKMPYYAYVRNGRSCLPRTTDIFMITYTTVQGPVKDEKCTPDVSMCRVYKHGYLLCSLDPCCTLCEPR